MFTRIICCMAPRGLNVEFPTDLIFPAFEIPPIPEESMLPVFGTANGLTPGLDSGELLWVPFTLIAFPPGGRGPGSGPETAAGIDKEGCCRFLPDDVGLCCWIRCCSSGGNDPLAILNLSSQKEKKSQSFDVETTCDLS